jgi:hypothetical protein
MRTLLFAGVAAIAVLSWSASPLLAQEASSIIGNHLSVNGGLPTLSACGTGPTLSANSTDGSGIITTGTGSPTACTLTFTGVGPFTASPECNVDAQVAGAPVGAAITTRSATAVTMTFASAMTSGTVDYFCVGR